MKNFFLTFCFLFAWSTMLSQDLTGYWEGELSQEGKAASFTYNMTIDLNGDAVNGTSFSSTSDGKASAHFLISGVKNGKEVILQEVKQLEPEAPKWCLKYINLKLIQRSGALFLEGNWQADGCTPGKLSLQHKPDGEGEQRELPFDFVGKWTGFLSQSDRDYGFYFEVNLGELMSGTSYIVSEGNGGSANMALEWDLDKENKELNFREMELLDKTDPRWRWCIKKGNLQFRRDDHRYILEGSWDGFIEGYSKESGGCAPGKVYLEKPVLTEEVKVARQQNDSYELEKKRKVKVERILEVQNKNIRIRVWDNGTVDGDVVTLFLNGKQILQNFRVSKRKWTKPVTLNAENNFLILHADDLGDITPNTVAVSIDDGVEEQIIILSSNLEESGAVLIKEFSIKE